MRVLIVNKFLRPFGGTEAVMFQEWSLLEDAGHAVIPFGLAHPGNTPSPYAPFWPEAPDFERRSPRAALALVWNGDASRRLARLVAAAKPDVAHVHNIYHQLTPSLLSVLDHAGVPAVLTVHDYKLICPNYRLYAAGEPCTRCVRSHPWHTVRLRCHQASAAASTLVALETALHRLFNVYGSVQRLIVPSRFLQQMLAAGGYAEQKIHLLQHPVPVATPPADALPQTLPRHMDLARAYLFAGRLEEEKGVRILLRAAQLVPELPVLVAGEGSLRAEIEGARVANVHLLGKLAPETLAAIRDRVRGELVPSLWPEPFGMSAAEAMGAGRAVIASDRGALPELVVDGHTGLLVPAANPQALAQAMKRLATDDQLARSLGNAGRKQIRRDHDPQRHLAALLATYHNIQEEKA